MKFVFKIFYLILFAAELCRADVDLRSRFGPILDKGNVGWCYAYTAADLLGHWLNARYPQLMNGNRVSATGVVLAHLEPRRAGLVSSMRGTSDSHRQYRQQVAAAEARIQELESQDDASEEDLAQAREALAEAQRKAGRTDANNFNVTERDIDEGGKAREAILGALRSGICYESSLSSQPLQVPDAAEDLRSLGMTEYSVAQLGRVLNSFISGADSSGHGPFRNLAQRLFSRYDFNRTSMTQLLAMPDPMGELQHAQCRDVNLQSVAPPVFTEMQSPQNSTGEMVNFIKATLDLGRPVEYGFDSRILNHPGAHSVTLVGYRNVGSGRVYLLRNMWGPRSCARDRAEMENPGFTCDDDGHYLIPEELLSSAISSVMRIENYSY